MNDLLPVVDGQALPSELRQILDPGGVVTDREGRQRMKPTHFYEVDSWETARSVQLAPYMSLWELISVDVREHPRVRAFPRYVPCGVTVLAAHLSALRQSFGTYLHVSANGGYRSPSHARSTDGSLHSWGTAADLYRVGDDYLEERETIERYIATIRELMPAVRCKPYGHARGEVDDHLHVDLGYLVVVP